ncbi:MAG TPA: hypothetical protein VN372_04785 [Methanospirillum sp.]|nr:hypothetical protein [Methanospirillum sp.]
MSTFIEKTRTDSGYQLCGRMMVLDGELQVYIDDIGHFSVPTGAVLATVAGLGDARMSGSIPGVARLSDSTRGLYMDIGETRYVTPVSRVRAVLSGKNRKAPVSRMK